MLGVAKRSLAMTSSRIWSVRPPSIFTFDDWPESTSILKIDPKAGDGLEKQK